MTDRLDRQTGMHSDTQKSNAKMPATSNWTQLWTTWIKHKTKFIRN